MLLGLSVYDDDAKPSSRPAVADVEPSKPLSSLEAALKKAPEKVDQQPVVITEEVEGDAGE